MGAGLIAVVYKLSAAFQTVRAALNAGGGLLSALSGGTLGAILAAQWFSSTADGFLEACGNAVVWPMLVCGGVLALLAWALATSGRQGGFSTQGYYAGTILPLLLIAGVGLWASLDFGGMWEMLHRTLIPDGIFPADELVMQLFPETLFSAYLPPVLLMLVLMLAAVLVLPLILSPVSARIAQSRAESAGGSNR